MCNNTFSLCIWYHSESDALSLQYLGIFPFSTVNIKCNDKVRGSINRKHNLKPLAALLLEISATHATSHAVNR